MVVTTGMVVTTMMSSHLCQCLAMFITNSQEKKYYEIVIMKSYPVVSNAITLS